MARILLIDDNDGFRSMLRTALERAEHHVVEASDGQEGYTTFKNGSFDLIITDIFMPVKEGIHTILDFKTEFPQTKIIAISGGGILANNVGDDDVLQLVNRTMSSQNILELARDFGADEVLKKPISIKRILQLIEYTMKTTYKKPKISGLPQNDV